MTTSDGTVLGAFKVLDNGSNSQRWNLVVVAEGYQSSEMQTFRDDVDDLVSALLATAPFDELEPAINVHRVEVASDESGADDPTACGGSGATAATYFDASFCNGGIRRLLQVDSTSVRNLIDSCVPQWHAILVLVNSSVYGGSGGQVAVTSRTGDWKEVAVHELGHSPFGLADEYEYWAGCGTDTDRDNHPAVEPSAPNVTIQSTQATIKWRNLIPPGTPVPTTQNADCSKCDPQPNPVAADTVGAFEGAHYYHCGAYRPTYDCKMRTLGKPFCDVCRCAIWRHLAPHMPPVYVGNPRSKEIHHIRSNNGNCQFCEMEQRTYFGTLASANAAGYDNCHWCIGGSTR